MFTSYTDNAPRISLYFDTLTQKERVSIWEHHYCLQFCLYSYGFQVAIWKTEKKKLKCRLVILFIADWSVSKWTKLNHKNDAHIKLDQGRHFQGNQNFLGFLASFTEHIFTYFYRIKSHSIALEFLNSAETCSYWIQKIVDLLSFIKKMRHISLHLHFFSVGIHVICGTI